MKTEQCHLCLAQGNYNHPVFPCPECEGRGEVDFYTTEEVAVHINLIWDRMGSLREEFYRELNGQVDVIDGLREDIQLLNERFAVRDAQFEDLVTRFEDHVYPMRSFFFTKDMVV